MLKQPKNSSITTKIIVFLSIILLISESTRSQDVTIIIHLRGVYESKISLLPLSGTNTIKPVTIVDSIKNGETTSIHVSKEYLPGEFVLRFDYKENASSRPYPSEKRIIISSHDLQLWLHPIYCNNADSTWFQKDEIENTTNSQFITENARQMTMLGLLQNFLLNYDDTNSAFYNEGINEYEKRRIVFNQWITSQIKKYRTLFAHSIMYFHYIPKIAWKGTESDRKRSLRNNYFDELDFSNPLLVRTSNMKEWMDGYVNLYGELATSITLRDSLFTYAGKTAIEKARTGHPLVYGWMVDYFFKGYESFNIEKGIKMLEPYLNDPNCLTAKRNEINKRLEGIKTIVPGTIAPNIIMQDSKNLPFELNTYQTGKNYILLLFWSADCSHCIETVDKLYSTYQQPEVQKNLDIVAISVDETATEIQTWQKKIMELNGWTHIRTIEGLRSKAASDYYIMGVPMMILLNAKTKKIVALPENTDQLDKLLSL